MSLKRRKSAGGLDGGASAARCRAGGLWRRLALASVALAALGLDGCASNPCNGCGLVGGIGDGFRRVGDGVRNTTGRIFRHKSRGMTAVAGCDNCGEGGAVEGMGMAMPMEGGMMSGGAVMPGPIIQAPPGAIDENPTILEPAAPRGSGAGMGGASGKPSSNVGPSGRAPVNSRTALGRSRSIQSDPRGRSENLARATLLPARPGGGVGGSGASPVATGPNPLDRVPPVDLSDEVARRASRSPVPVEAELVTPPVPDRPIAGLDNGGDAGRETDRSADLPAIRAGLDTTLAPGLKHFAGVRPKISGGSLPNVDGLDWLKEKGIKTILDLREPTEVDKPFLDLVNARGFRYVSLPIVAAKLDAASLARFNDELTRPDGHPVYFFDGDGTRAGLVWYIHRLTVDKVDAQIASREAEELGLADKSAWLAASKYIEGTRPAPSPAARLDLPRSSALPFVGPSSVTREAGSLASRSGAGR